MIVCSGTIQLDPAHQESAIAAMSAVAAATLEEDGCITYGFWPHPTEAGLFRVYEEWESNEAMGVHMGTPHMAEFLTAMMGFGVTATSITAHTVSESNRLM